MEYSDICMLTGVANCARTPPILLPVDPLPWELSRSSSKTFLQPAVVRCHAILEPTIPPPMITTSAVCMVRQLLLQIFPLIEQDPQLRQRQLGCLGLSYSGRCIRAIYCSEQLCQRAYCSGNCLSATPLTSFLWLNLCQRLQLGIFSFTCCMARVEAVDFIQSTSCLLDTLCQLCLQYELLFQILSWRRDSRIHDQLQRLRKTLAVDGEFHAVISRQCLRSFRFRWHVPAITRRHAESTGPHWWRSVTQVPNKAMHSRFR